jgi:hypothetical protein
LWFYALLVNNRQDSRDLLLSLKETIAGNEILPQIPSALLSHPVFSPEQIFWDPEGRRVNRQWLPLWEQSMGMGFDLLQSAIHPGLQWSPGKFITAFDNLRTEVKAAMFTGFHPPEEAAVRVNLPAEDESIHKILKGIIGRWCKKEIAETHAERPEEESDTIETIILSPAEVCAPDSPIRGEEEWTETVVLSARGVIEPPPSSPRDPGSDVVLETVVLPPGGAKSEPSTSASLDEVEDAVPETVILSSGVCPEGTPRAKSGPEFGPTEERKEEAAKGDDLPETVILTPQRKRVKPKGWKE